jgi:hypothetical protein
VQLPGRQPRRDVRAAEGPAAAEREVEAEPEVTRSLRSKAEVGQEGIRTELGSGGRQRVDVGHLHPAETSLGHRSELALQLRPGHRRAEPPPAHSRCRAQRWIGKTRVEIVDSYGPGPLIRSNIVRKRFLIV